MDSRIIHIDLIRFKKKNSSILRIKKEHIINRFIKSINTEQENYILKINNKILAISNKWKSVIIAKFSKT